MFKLPKKIIEDKQKFKEALGKYLAGEMKDAFFKGIRVPWGNYSQRGGKILMSRLRVPGGILAPVQLKAIGEAAQKFAGGKLHLTTRQDIQIHNVPFENSIKIVEYLEGFDISPRGGGGNTVRNVTGCYLSGICPLEKIEVYRLVEGLTEHLLALEEAYHLPRKFKISFSGCDEDCAFAGVNDVGLVALADDSFKVLCGGGMGAKSSVGKIIEEKVEVSEIGSVVRAIMNVFNQYGDYKNRHHNRLRFLIQNLGWEKFVGLYREELKKLKETEPIVLRMDEITHPLSPSLIKRGGKEGGELENKEYQQFLKYNVGEQKQKGYRYIHLRVPFGEISSETLIKLSQLEDLVPTIDFRTTQRQNLVIGNVPEDKVSLLFEKIKTFMKDYLYPETIFDVISCKAATTCNLGVCNTIALAPEVVKALGKMNLDIDKLKEVKINMNGCPNACGQHPLGEIALSGLARKVFNRSVPFYKIYLGGKVDAENTQLAEEVGTVPARVVPQLLAEYVGGRNGKPNKTAMLALIKKYSSIPPYEEDKSYYIDFGQTAEFSFEGISQGECGAGVIDMIESDLQSAKQALAQRQVKEALIYASRALLVVKGLDPRDEKETVSTLVASLVQAGIVEPAFSNLEHIYADILSGKFSGQNAWDYAQSLYEEVKKTYTLMDSNFNFQVRFEAQAQAPVQAKGAPLYDLRGVPCPLNYVKTKIRLEGMEIGKILEVYLDDGEPIRNVPRSLEADGQELLKVEPVENYFRVIVKKKV